VYCLWIFLSWLPSYLVDFRHFTLLKMGYFASPPLFAGVVGNTLGGWLTDILFVKTKNIKFARRSVAIVGMLGCGGFILPAALTSNPLTAVYCLTGSMFFLELIIGPAWAVPMDIGGGILGHRLRHDEHGGEYRWGSVAHSVRLSGGSRVLGRAFRGGREPAIHRCSHLGVLAQSGSVRG
jgi:MFS family permease